MTYVPVRSELGSMTVAQQSPYHVRIEKLAQRSLELTLGKIGSIKHGWRTCDPASLLAPMAVLALAGDQSQHEQFISLLREMAQSRWGVDRFGTASGLDDSFAMRSIVEAYRGLINADMIDEDDQDRIASWLYDFAMIRADGRIMQMPSYQSWHVRNQNVPATSTYEIAALLDDTQPGRFQTEAIWKWADERMVGWDLNWRTPDDSWLYQFIWVWSAFRHAALRRPELIDSPNARKSIDFYRTLSVPGGIDLVFGDTRPLDLIGPMVALVLGAHLYKDGELLWIAEELLKRQEAHSDHWMLTHRAPELYRLYWLWPADLQPQKPQRQSTLLCSPLAGRGWSIGETPYAIEVKTTDKRFPAYQRDTFDWDDLYQVRDPHAYALEKPDKIVFSEQDNPGGMFALLDLRAHGLHDHPDALNLVTLIDQGMPWLVESGYMPRVKNRIRWMHNVPLFRRGKCGPEELRNWKSDTWREVQAGDVTLERLGDYVLSSATLRHDAFDYVSFDGDLFDVQRVCLMKPESFFLVVDILNARASGPVTLGQIWHTPARLQSTEQGIVFCRNDRQMHASFQQTCSMQLELTHHTPTETDPLYFPGVIHDLLWHATTDVSPGHRHAMAALFSRQSTKVSISSDSSGFTVHCDDARLRIPHQGTPVLLK